MKHRRKAKKPIVRVVKANTKENSMAENEEVLSLIQVVNGLINHPKLTSIQAKAYKELARINEEARKELEEEAKKEAEEKAAAEAKAKKEAEDNAKKSAPKGGRDG